MSIHISGPIVAPNTTPGTDLSQTLTDLIPTQLNHTRNQLANLLAKTASQATSAAVFGAAGAAPVVAQTVAEITSALVENRIYEATQPLPLDPSVRGRLAHGARQEVFNSAQGVDAPVSWQGAEPPRMKRIETPFGERLIPDAKPAHPGLLGDIFGSTSEIHRERERRAAEANQSLMPPRIRSLL